MDLTFKVEETCFNYALDNCKQDNKILILQGDGEDFGTYPVVE